MQGICTAHGYFCSVPLLQKSLGQAKRIKVSKLFFPHNYIPFTLLLFQVNAVIPTTLTKNKTTKSHSTQNSPHFLFILFCARQQNSASYCSFSEHSRLFFHFCVCNVHKSFSIYLKQQNRLYLTCIIDFQYRRTFMMTMCLLKILKCTQMNK